MVVEDQTLALAFLRDPKTNGEFASSVVTVETHISVSFLLVAVHSNLNAPFGLLMLIFPRPQNVSLPVSGNLSSIGELLRRYIVPFAGSPARRMAAWVSTDKVLSSTLWSKWFGSMRKLFLTGWQYGVH